LRGNKDFTASLFFTHKEIVMKKMFLGLLLLLMASLSIQAQNNGIRQNQSDFTMSNQLDTSMNTAERTYLLNLLKETQTLFDQGTSAFSTDQLAFKPGTDKWSVFEVLEHIAVVETGIFSIVQGALTKPADPSRRDEIKVSAEQIVKILTNRNGKAQAPEQVKPTGRFPNAMVAREAFRRQHEQITAFIQSSNADLHNRYWKHPATGVIDLYQTLVLIAAHTQRHLLQIEEIKQTEGFPKGR